MKGIKNRGSMAHGLHKDKPKYREYHDDIDYDRYEYLERREKDEWDKFNQRYPDESTC